MRPSGSATAVANVPAARSGTASSLVNTARMVGATLGVAVLGALFAMFADGGSGHVAAGLPPAFIVGGIGEMLGAVAAFTFIRRDSLNPGATPSSFRGSTARSAAPSAGTIRRMAAARTTGRPLPVVVPVSSHGPAPGERFGSKKRIAKGDATS